MIEARGLVKQYRSTLAVDNLSFDVRPGTLERDHHLIRAGQVILGDKGFAGRDFEAFVRDGAGVRQVPRHGCRQCRLRHQPPRRGLPGLAGHILASYPGIGPFLAYQILTDLGYSDEFGFSEDEFTMPGPGALDGIAKCFGKKTTQVSANVIRYMAATQDEQFDRLGLEFPRLRGRPLQLIDIQNLFCEISKYARVAHPDIPG